MKRFSFLLLVMMAACHQSNDHTSPKDSTVVVSHDTIPEARKTVKAAPAAEYSEVVPDELNNWKFAVALYETEKTFHYTVRIQAKELRQSDSINIPNFGIEPTVQIHKGKEPFTCIIGFLNKKNEFMEYRKVSFKNDQLHVSTINNFSVGVYKTKAN